MRNVFAKPIYTVLTIMQLLLLQEAKKKLLCEGILKNQLSLKPESYIEVNRSTLYELKSGCAAI